MPALEDNLAQMEQARERYWRRCPSTGPFKLRWRALTVRHCFHVLPGERIFEIGAGSGLWTEHLTRELKGKNPITAAVFNDEYLSEAQAKNLTNTTFVKIDDAERAFEPNSFDYVVGMSILSHDRYPQTLRLIESVLKPGGQMLFFEANFWNPLGFVKNAFPWIGRMMGNAPCQVAFRRTRLMHMTSQQGLAKIDVIPYDIIHPRTPRFLLRPLQSVAFILEHTPLMQRLCGQLYIWAQKPDSAKRPRQLVDLTEHRSLYGSTSFVVPCYNEEMNIRGLVDALVASYDNYIHEIVIVNDNSTDRTAEVTRAVATREPRVKLINRTPPNGVGRGLREGYAAATGRYIFSIDSDFIQIVPEFRDLFDAVAQGRDGAIGSRFSYESVLINYPFMKILCNRAFHLMANMLLPVRFRDVTNNLKLCRAEVLKGITIEEDHFAANAETGLKPIMAGYDIKEVPISWINRTIDMGTSSFRILRLAKGYFFALMRTVVRAWRHRNQLPVAPVAAGKDQRAELHT